MTKLNFDIAPCGKTYYEINTNWKQLKLRIKNILDDTNSCKINKINLIIGLLENYKFNYLISRGEQNVKNKN